MTKTIYFSTVGLNFYKDQDIDIDDYISLLIGKTVILQHDTENADRYAIAVTLDGKIIGYVRRNDIDENNIHGYLMGCYHHCHIARFVAPSTLYKTIITEAKFIDVIPITAEKEIIESNWGIDTIKPEPIAEWRELTRVMNSMLTLLIYKVANVSNMRPLIDQYKKLAVLGFSKDFYDDRQELFRLLGECGDKDARDAHLPARHAEMERRRQYDDKHGDVRELPAEHRRGVLAPGGVAFGVSAHTLEHGPDRIAAHEDAGEMDMLLREVLHDLEVPVPDSRQRDEQRDDAEDRPRAGRVADQTPVSAVLGRELDGDCLHAERAVADRIREADRHIVDCQHRDALRRAADEGRHHEGG